MSDPLDIPIGPERTVWVFAIDLPLPEAEAFAQGDIAATLGVDHLDPAQTQFVDPEAFKGFGFARYLEEGQGLMPDSLAPDSQMLDALRDPLLLVFRPGLGQGRLSPRPPLRLIGRYDEVPSPMRVGMPAYDPIKDSIPVKAKKRPSDAAMSGRVAMVVLIFLAIFVALFIWSAG
ncbi:MAG: hypothetical protein ACK4RZ_06235 [Paracoccaceae bacterium]